MKSEEYRLMVCNAVHDLRVDPFDEATRLILADLIEENGAEGMVDRTTKHLRDGKMVGGTIDKEATMLLRFVQCAGTDAMKAAFSKKANKMSSFAQPFTPGVGNLVLSLEDFDWLWTQTCRYLKQLQARSKFSEIAKTVCVEAEKVKADRRNKKPKQMGEAG